MCCTSLLCVPSPDRHLSSTHHFTAQLPTSLSTTVSSVQYSSSGPILEHSMKEPEIDEAALAISSESGPSSSVSASLSSHQADLEHAQRLAREDQDVQHTSSLSPHSSISSSPSHSPTPDSLENPAESLHPGPPLSSAHHTPPSATSSSPSSPATADNRSQDQSHSLTDVSTCSSHDNLPLSSPVLTHSVAESPNAIRGGNETKPGHISTAKREPHSLSESSMVERLEQDRQQGSREPARAGPTLAPVNSLNEDGLGREAQAVQGHRDNLSEDPPLPTQETDLQGATVTQEAGIQYFAKSNTPPSDLLTLEPVGQSASRHFIPAPVASQAVTTCAESPKQLSRSDRSSITSGGVCWLRVLPALSPEARFITLHKELRHSETQCKHRCYIQFHVSQVH